MYRVEDPVFAMAESSFLDGGSRLADVDMDPLTTFSGGSSVADPNATLPDVGRCRSSGPGGKLQRRLHPTKRQIGPGGWVVFVKTPSG